MTISDKIKASLPAGKNLIGEWQNNGGEPSGGKVESVNGSLYGVNCLPDWLNAVTINGYPYLSSGE